MKCPTLPLPFPQDRYAEGIWTPTVDESQDVKLLGGYQNDTHTVLRFSRPWVTLDTSTDYMLGVGRVPHIADHLNGFNIYISVAHACYTHIHKFHLALLPIVHKRKPGIVK